MIEQVMKCRRCGGMMIATYSDLLSPSARGEDVFGWRCVNCGDYIDRQVLGNRTHEPSSMWGHRHRYALMTDRRQSGRF